MEQKTYHKQTAKFLAVVAENMPEFPDYVMQNWIQNPKGIKNVLKEALWPSLKTQDFPVSLRLTIGGYKSPEKLKELVIRKGFSFSVYCEELFLDPKFGLIPQQREVEVIVIAVRDLGLRQGGRYEEICQTILDKGHSLCPPELAPLMRVVEKGPTGKKFHILMHPLRTEQFGYRTFLLHGGEYLGNRKQPNRPLSPDTLVVFVRGKLT